jgi:hypothetical protein
VAYRETPFWDGREGESKMKAFFAAVTTAVFCVGIGFAGPAAADVNDLTGAGAFGVSVNATVPGGPSVSVGPIPSVDLPGGGGSVSDSLASVNAAPVLTAGVLNVSSEGANLGTHAGFSTSTAEVANANLLTGALTAELITATCTSNGDGSTGSSSLLSASAGGNPLDVSPPPNTTIPIATIGTIVLNEQIVTNTPGVETTITVNAIHITLDVGGITGDVIISQARCRAAGPDVLNPGGPGGAGGPGAATPVVAEPSFTG